MHATGTAATPGSRGRRWCRPALRDARRSTTVTRVHNSAAMSTRGEHLLTADRRFATGGGRVARLVAPAFGRILDHIEEGIPRGGIHLRLPSGDVRSLGFRAPGPAPTVEIKSW